MKLSRLRVGVVGVGHVGQHHARIMASLSDVDLVAVVDVNKDRAIAVAETTGALAETDIDALVGRVDAVNIAVPTDAHMEVALPFLERGISVLVEKPISCSIIEADALIAAAHASGAVLAVGHTERYNPAVITARTLVDSPRFIEVHRLSSFSSRSLDIDVVFDVMIHDLDVLLTVVQSEVTSIEAVGVSVLSERVDIANARLRFASGCIANITASRISREQIRKVRFFQAGAYLSIDYAAQEVDAWRLVKSGQAPPSIEGGQMNIEKEEPLRLELLDFVSAVRHHRAPEVTGEDGRRALALAQRITDQMKVRK